MGYNVTCLMVKKEHFIVLEYLKDFKMLETVPMLLDYHHYMVNNIKIKS